MAFGTAVAKIEAEGLDAHNPASSCLRAIRRESSMPKFHAVLMFPQGAREGRYEFEAPSSFMQNAPARIVDQFLATVDGLDLPDAVIDNEINTAHNYRDISTVTATGSMYLRAGGVVPFVAMISPAASTRL